MQTSEVSYRSGTSVIAKIAYDSGLLLESTGFIAKNWIDLHRDVIPGGTYEQRYVDELDASFRALQRKGITSSNAPGSAPLKKEVLMAHLRQWKEEVDRQYDAIVKALLDLEGEQPSTAIEVFDLYCRPRTSPMVILQRLNKDHVKNTPTEWRERIADYGVGMTQLQRAERMVAFMDDPPALESELRNPGHANWKPLDYPDTLLLEIDSGLMVREVQESVAKSMRDPPSGKNTTMQLLMGEGKSSVILPIVAAALADGSRIVRIFVSKPQSKQTQQMLESQLGGLVNQAEALALFCIECMTSGGILLVQPEHTLSFQLMGVETAINGKMDLSQEGSPGLPMATQPRKVQSAVLEYITKSSLSQAEIEAVEKSSLWSPLTRNTLLLFRGLLASQILAFVFCQKRWKVDHGLDPTRNPITQLAVPYRAKDSPSARSEFSHPEIIMMLTSLSYYYGGMTDEDLLTAFSHLLRSDQADMEYQVWVADSDHLPHAFGQLSGINLDDREQCTEQVFPCFRLVQACMRMRKLGKGQSVTFCIPDEIQQKIVSRQGNCGRTIAVSDILEWAISETYAEVRRGIWLWANQGRRHRDHRIIWKEARIGGSTDLDTNLARRFLEEEAQTLEQRYRPKPPKNPRTGETSSLSSIEGPDAIIERLLEFDGLEEDSATFREEQERELSPEIEQEREIQRPPSEEPAEHFLHPDIRRFVSHGVLPKDSKSFTSAFQALSDTTAARHFDADRLSTSLLASSDFVHTIKSTRRGYTSDLFQRSVQWILTRHSSNGIVDIAIIVSPFEAQELFHDIKRSNFISLHLYSPRPNMGFRPLDDLSLYTIPHRAVFSPTPALSLRTELNLFSGQLYLKSMEEYRSIQKFLGLPPEPTSSDQSISRAPDLSTEALMQFMKVLMTQIRRNCESIDKTHMGRILDHRVLGPLDFS
ncbi:hypothetical protein K4K61_003395 [Colletotrichum sp. SAR11_59]|nr:hypothetical protein K4K61_003395 [Colletotrichum sp. SAR11_59]